MYSLDILTLQAVRVIGIKFLLIIINALENSGHENWVYDQGGWV